MAWLVPPPPPLDCVRLETVDDVDVGVNKEVAGVTSERRRFGGGVGVLESGLGEEALFVAVLDKLSTKLDLTDRATAVNVARRSRLLSVGEGLSLEEAARSTLRYSIVVVVVGWSVPGICCCWLVVGLWLALLSEGDPNSSTRAIT
jgi:hypothetical protein